MMIETLDILLLMYLFVSTQIRALPLYSLYSDGHFSLPYPPDEAEEEVVALLELFASEGVVGLEVEMC